MVYKEKVMLNDDQRLFGALTLQGERRLFKDVCPPQEFIHRWLMCEQLVSPQADEAVKPGW